VANNCRRHAVLLLLSIHRLSGTVGCSRSGGYLSAERAKPTIANRFSKLFCPLSGRRARGKGYDYNDLTKISAPKTQDRIAA
jgi:hypothetical protein